MKLIFHWKIIFKIAASSFIGYIFVNIIPFKKTFCLLVCNISNSYDLNRTLPWSANTILIFWSGNVTSSKTAFYKSVLTSSEHRTNSSRIMFFFFYVFFFNLTQSNLIQSEFHPFPLVPFPQRQAIHSLMKKPKERVTSLPWCNWERSRRCLTFFSLFLQSGDILSKHEQIRLIC